MMRLSLVALMLALVAMMAGAPSANAKNFWEDSDSAETTRTHARHSYKKTSYKKSGYRREYARSEGRSSVGGRPSRWCGWWMRTQKGGGPEYNLAANWRHWGSPSGPQVGAVVVWPHHVGMITGRTASGQWIVKSGNDGGAVRERARSVAGATFRVG